MSENESGAKQGEGRPADPDKVFARRVVETPEARQHIEDVLGKKVEPNKEWLAYYKYMSDRAYGRPAQPIEGGDERKPLAIRIIPYEKP